MGITGGFGVTIDLERGTSRQWVMGRDGVKRWADTNEPVDERPLDRIVRQHRWGHNEGGYRLCLDCGTAENKKPFDGHIYWLAGRGYNEDPGCRKLLHNAFYTPE